MRILVCDDDKSFLSVLTAHVQEYFKNHFIKCWIDAETDPLKVANNDIKYDIAFLDIQMEGLDGIALAKDLKTRNGKVALFFVTNYNDYSDEAFDLHAFRYFQKPFDPARLYRSLDKAMEYINDSYVTVFVREENHNRRVLVDDILYVKRENRKTFLITNSEVLNVTEAFTALIEKIPATFFYLVHNSFYVNLHHVIDYSYRELILCNNDRISIAPRKQAGFHKFWYSFLRRN